MISFSACQLMLFSMAVRAAERCTKKNDSDSGRDILTTSTLNLLITTFVKHGLHQINATVKGACINIPNECIIAKALLPSRTTHNTRHLKDKRSCGLQERRDKLRVLLAKEREELEVREMFEWVCVCVCVCTAFVLTSSERDEEFVVGQNVCNAS